MEKIATVLYLLSIAAYSESAISGWASPIPAITGAASGNVQMTAIAENSVVVGAAIFTATATAASGTPTYTYVLVSSTNNVGVMGTAGAVNLAPGKALDYETAVKYVFVVVATDPDSTKGTATVTVTLTDVNEAPEFSPAAQGLCVTTGTAAGAAVATLSGKDPEGLAVIYAITGGNTNTDFEISGSSLKTKNALNMETTGGYALTISGTDPGSNSKSLTLYVSVSTASGASAVAATSLSLIMTLVLFIYL